LSSVLTVLLSRRGASLLRGRRPGGAGVRRQRLQVLGADASRLPARLQDLRLRTKQARLGSYSFKKNWGFEPQPLHYEYCLYKRDAVPQNNPANAKYKLLIEAWRRMPMPVANWLGTDRRAQPGLMR
jgi:hypothetical protein